VSKQNVQVLLEQWKKLIDIGEQVSIQKARRNKDGLKGRIRRTSGMPVIFAFDSYDKQRKLQNLLCKELPQFADLIRSTPEIMDGHPWKRKDFIELYFSHYRIVVEKLRRLTSQSTNV